MKILFRTDGNAQIGFGHLIRCVSIVNEIRKQSELHPHEIKFLGSFSDAAKEVLLNEKILFQLAETHEEFNLLSENISIFRPDVLFIDRVYNYSEEEIKALKKNCRIIMMHYISPGIRTCDHYILPSEHTPQNLIDESGMMTGKGQVHMGADYIVLNHKLSGLRRNTYTPAQHIQIAITTGGSDPKQVLLKILRILMVYSWENVRFKVLYGLSIAFGEELEKLKKVLPAYFTVIPYNEKELIDADLAICTFGITTYELLYLGIPVISVSHAESNALGSKTLAQKHHDIIADLGLAENLTSDALITCIKSLIQDADKRIYMAESGKLLVDGRGVSRVAEIIINSMNQ